MYPLRIMLMLTQVQKHGQCSLDVNLYFGDDQFEDKLTDFFEDHTENDEISYHD